MKFHGIKEWRNHTPGMRGKKLLVIPLTIIGSVVGTLFFYFILENIDRWFPTPSLIELEPWLPIIGSIIALSCAYLLVFSIWHRRAELLAHNKKTAYQHALIPGLAGMSSLLTSIIHVYDPLDMFPAGYIGVPPPANPLTNTLATSLWNLLGLPYSATAHLFQEVLGIAVAVFGLLMVVRAFEVLGIDYATVVYLYYPEESKLVDHKIYSIVRNPLYAGAIVVGFGGVLLRLSAYSAILWLLVLLVFSVHIHFVEDKELIKRFGASFRKYQQTVPSLFVRPRNWGRLVLFLFGKWR